MADISVDIGRPADDAELRAFAEVTVHSLGFPPLEETDWLSREHTDGIRVARVGGEVVGGYELIPFQQAQRGAPVPVPMGGVRCVSVTPHLRGRGVATALLRQALADCREQGFPISVLYPSTQPVYRRVGYEQAGARVIWRLKLASAIAARPTHDITFEPIRGADAEAAVDLLHAAFATHRPGNLERGAWGWGRVRDPLAGGPSRGYCILRGGEPAGYAYLRNERASGNHHHVQLLDYEVRDPEIAQALLWFAYQHRAMGQELRWVGPPADPLVRGLRSQHAEVVRHMHWMLRVVDWRDALSRRGWPAGTRAALRLEIADDVCPGNAGRWQLDLSAGQLTVEPTDATPELRLTARALGPLYTGHMTPHALVETGLAEADEATCAKARAMFAGPAPWLREMF